MQILSSAKDGGKDSPVTAFFLIEWKGLFSIALLKFNKGSREAYHTHAFHAWTWFLWGSMTEERLYDRHKVNTKYRAKLKPKFTHKDNLHRVIAHKDSWCFTLRGPWSKTWREYDHVKGLTTVFGHGRKVLSITKESHQWGA